MVSELAYLIELLMAYLVIMVEVKVCKEPLNGFQAR